MYKDAQINLEFLADHIDKNRGTKQRMATQRNGGISMPP